MSMYVMDVWSCVQFGMLSVAGFGVSNVYFSDYIYSEFISSLPHTY
jgi:hypothetical protein